jgi:hypothetical protein
MSTGSLPAIIAEWQRSDRERIRVTLDHDAIDVRCFFLGDDEDPPRPGRTGITLPLRHLPAMAAGLHRALTEAHVRGLIDGCSNG